MLSQLEASRVLWPHAKGVWGWRGVMRDRRRRHSLLLLFLLLLTHGPVTLHLKMLLLLLPENNLSPRGPSTLSRLHARRRRRLGTLASPLGTHGASRDVAAVARLELHSAMKLGLGVVYDWCIGRIRRRRRAAIRDAGKPTRRLVEGRDALTVAAAALWR